MELFTVLMKFRLGDGFVLWIYSTAYGEGFRFTDKILFMVHRVKKK